MTNHPKLTIGTRFTNPSWPEYEPVEILGQTRKEWLVAEITDSPYWPQARYRIRKDHVAKIPIEILPPDTTLQVEIRPAGVALPPPPELSVQAREAGTIGVPALPQAQERMLTRAEFQRLSDIPPEAEWFANITNPNATSGLPERGDALRQGHRHQHRGIRSSLSPSDSSDQRTRKRGGHREGAGMAGPLGYLHHAAVR